MERTSEGRHRWKVVFRSPKLRLQECTFAREGDLQHHRRVIVELHPGGFVHWFSVFHGPRRGVKHAEVQLDCCPAVVGRGGLAYDLTSIRHGSYLCTVCASTARSNGPMQPDLPASSVPSLSTFSSRSNGPFQPPPIEAGFVSSMENPSR